jgi:hypothetical protein
MSKGKEITGEWRKSHDEELHGSLVGSSNQGKKEGVACGMYKGEVIQGSRVGGTEAKGPLGRPKRKWKDKIT